ncbi:hypothetical protein EON82_22375 [bacterium]|nr:MAG: hypothetical protein EON82_22375 [bacterium]
MESLPYRRLLERLVGVCSQHKGGLLFIRGGGARLGIYSHPAFRYVDAEAHEAIFGTLAGVPVAYGRGLEPYGAVFVPPGSVQVRYGEKATSATVEVVDGAKAEAIVREWESGRESFTEEERTEQEARLQESCHVRLLVRSEAVGEGILAFVSDDLKEDPL